MNEMYGEAPTDSLIFACFILACASWMIGEYPRNGTKGKGCQDGSFSVGSKVRCWLKECN